MTIDREFPREVAYYYPDPMWASGDWVKNLILFFDGIALLVPQYLTDKPRRLDPAIVTGLEQHGLLHIIQPEQAVDAAATVALGDALESVIQSGVLDSLAHDGQAFHSLSRSRLGYYGNEEIAQRLFGELKKRKLARDTEDGVSVPIHRHVRALVLVLLSQILRSYGARLGAELCPATDVPHLVHALGELLSAPQPVSSGAVVEFDLAAVAVNLGPVPIDEVLDYRQQNLSAHRLYSASARQFANELSRMDTKEREDAFLVRQAELDDMASDLRSRSRKAWRKPASFCLGLAGAAVSIANGNPLAALFSVGASTLGYQSATPKPAGAYSYLFNAQARFRS